MAVVALLIAIPLTLLLRGGSNDAGNAPQPSQSNLPKPGKRLRDKALGISARLPKGWTEEKRASTINLKSGDGKAAIAIAAPGSAARSAAILDDAVATLKRQYAKAKVTGAIKGEKTGGLPSKGAVLSARAKKGGPRLRVLISVARGQKLSYLIEVFATDLASDSVAEAQTVLRFLELSG